MLKLRLKRIGRKRAPFYRLVLMENTSRRDGKAIKELGWYNPISKKYFLKTEEIKYYLQQGVKPTKTTFNLLEKVSIFSNFNVE